MSRAFLRHADTGTQRSGAIRHTDVRSEGRRAEAGRVGETRWRQTQTSHLRAILSLSLSLSLSLPRSLATLVTPTTGTPVQDNISLILPLVFHLASTHLGRDTQR
jgi:hypothetical protein